MDKKDKTKAFDVNESKRTKNLRKKNSKSNAKTSSKDGYNGTAFRVNKNTSGTDK